MFNKNKRKTNYKIRFQNLNFKRRLEQQRSYKRSPRALPQTAWGIFLVKIGLGSWVSMFGVLLIFLLLIYIVFVPNVFFIKQVRITGADGQNLASIETSINSFLNKKIPWQQKNLLLLSKNNLNNYLIKNNQKVLKVNKITKDFPSTLILDIDVRLDKFAIQTSASFFSVSNDGLVTSVVEPNASGTLPSNLILIKLNKAESLTVGHAALPEKNADFILKLQYQMPGLLRFETDYYQLTNLQSPDLIVHFKNDFKILFDLNSDFNKSFGRLKLLFSQFSDADIKNLQYVDMRFEDRGYVCAKDAPCIRDSKSASSTPIN